ncbi:hypothetical protein D3C77_556000 [compost metagenome]
MQQQRGLADTRITANQHDRAGHQAAAQHAVEFIQPGGLAGRFAGFDFRQAANRAGRGQWRVAVRGGGGGG